MEWIDLFNGDRFTAVQNESMITLALFGLLLAYLLAKKISLLAGLLFGVYVISATRISTIGLSPYQYDLGRFYMFQELSLRSIHTVFTVVFLVLLSSQLWIKRMIDLIRIMAVLDAILVLMFNGRGIYYNDSMDGSLIACLIPIMAGGWKWTIPLLILGVLKSHSVTAFVACLIAILFLPRLRVIKALAVAALCAGCYIFHLHHGPMVTSGRIELWTEVIEFWKDHSSGYDASWLGFGPGSFTAWEPTIHNVRWVYLHNDYLQCFFELGWIAFILMVLMQFYCILRMKGPIRLCGILWSMCMFAQPMIHHAVGGLISAMLVRISHGGKHEFQV